RRQHEVAVHYKLTDHGYRLIADNYNHNRELVIDPLLYGTYLGNTGEDYGYGVCADASGGFAVCGYTRLEMDFPTTPGAYQTEADGLSGFITRFNEDGSDLVFSTYLGAPFPSIGYDTILRSVFIDDSGRVICTGSTRTREWPITENAIQDSLNGGFIDAVFTILSPDGSTLVYSTYLGGGRADTGTDLLYDGQGSIYCCGEASGWEPPFPTTPDAIFPEFTSSPEFGAFLLRFDLTTMSLDYSTVLPFSGLGRAWTMSLAEPGVVLMGGDTYAFDLPVTPNAHQPEIGNPNSEYTYDGFIALWDLNANELRYCSYWGGESNEGLGGISFLLDSLIVVGGSTYSSDFPTTEGVLEPERIDTLHNGLSAFISVIDPNSEQYISTYFGSGSSAVTLNGIKADSAGISFFGRIGGQNLPLSSNAYDTTFNDGVSGQTDNYTARLTTDLTTLEYGSYLGGNSREDIYGGRFDDHGYAWLCGQTYSGDLPTTDGAYDRVGSAFGDCYVLKFDIPDLDTPVRIRPLIPYCLELLVFPNPFNPSTTISFTLPRQAQTSLEVFNVLGQAVYAVDLGQLPVGEYHHLLDAASLPSGTYLTRLDAGELQETSRMVLLR
ncbi:T9SS type A sorting domain-containing protein, partial [bacterium]|nr:T9SS type A sorting domain-containing protein [bacterium]